MRLEITRRADLATKGLLELAGDGGRLKASDLASRIGTTGGFLSQAMTPLVSMGWVRSDPGPTGGYQLSVDPGELNVLEVIEAVEGPTESGRCVLENRPCAATPCVLHQPWAVARGKLLAELSSTALSSLATGTSS